MKSKTTPLLLLAASVNGLATIPSRALVPEVHLTHLTRVAQLVSSALGDGEESPSSRNRYASVREAVGDFQSASLSSVSASAELEAVPSNELVYGELSLPVLSTILDAVGVHEEDVFLDIGSGDGALVLGASLLYANYNEGGMGSEHKNNAIRKSYGADIVTGLVDRSKIHAQNLERMLELEDDVTNNLGKNQAEVQLLLGDIHKPNEELQHILREVTLAVCFATTWSAGNAHQSDGNNKSSMSLQGRKLPKLSKALSSGLTSGCRVVIIDGKLNEDDGFSWEGDLRIQCPDTAPYSVATLYHKL